MVSERLAAEPLYAPAGTAAEHRIRVQQAADERAAQRHSELESQASVNRNPEERIGIWERLHELRLPRGPEHALVRVIAKQTRLSVGQVHEEQRRRAGMRSQSPNVVVAHDQRIDDNPAIHEDKPMP